MQARSAHSLKVQGWLREEALEWGIRIDTDIAAKEKDTEQVKQERQRDLIKLKVQSLHSSCKLGLHYLSLPLLSSWQTAHASVL